MISDLHVENEIAHHGLMMQPSLSSIYSDSALMSSKFGQVKTLYLAA